MTPTASRFSEARRALVLVALVGLTLAPFALADTTREAEQLRRDLDSLSGKERSVLDELRRLETQARLRRVEEQDAAARIAELSATIDDRTVGLARLEAEQAQRRRYLAFRMREMYKRGPGAPLGLLVQRGAATDAMRGLRYATFLNERDARTMRVFRADSLRLAQEREDLVGTRTGLDSARADAEKAAAELDRSRAEQSRYLTTIRRDRKTHEDALRELDNASRELSGLTDRSADAPVVPREAPQRGGLAWPVSGKISAGFGRVTHPQFKTVVPHPGLDLEATEGSDFRAVAGGAVVYSAWLRGYGLTAIVDHGGGLLSVYAHAAALLVEQGESVGKGETLGKVGDTGSLRGPYLYFELREAGKPVDPVPWLERR